MILCLTYRYWEAVKHWDEAIQLTPTSAVLHEMKSQVFTLAEEEYVSFLYACVDCLHMYAVHTSIHMYSRPDELV